MEYRIMVFSKNNNIPSPYITQKNNKIVVGQKISTFLGHLQVEGSNILNYQLGELMFNKNMEWRYSGSSKFIRTKRGSSLHLDISVSVLGAGVFYKSGQAYKVWVDKDGNLKYEDALGAEQTLTTGLDTTYRHEFWYYGLNGNETLYGANRTDGVYKITMPLAAMTYTSVLSTTGAWSMSYSKISGRLIITNGHKALYGDIQNQTSTDTTNLEAFDIVNQTLLVNPDLGDGIMKVIDNGEITFYFKDTGIWALINAEEEIANWLQPQCNADVGTKSPETVTYVKYGKSEVFIYLGTDKTLRLFSAQVERNSGARPTLKGGNSLVISNPFQLLLNQIPDAYVGKCRGFYFDGYYILNIVSDGAIDIDTTIIIDLDKLSAAEGTEDVSQPYWFYTDNMEYTNFIIEDNQTLYGFHKNGYISEVLVNDIYYEEVPDRIYPLQEFRDYLVISSVTGTFRRRETVTGSVSLNTATTTTDVSDTALIVKDPTGNFTVGETVTGSKSGATGVITSITRRIAIEWAAYISWHKYSEREVKLYDAYLNWAVEGNWPINFTVNSFVTGDSIPNYDEGIAYSILPQHQGGAYYDASFFDEAYFNFGSGQLSQNTGGQGRGNYFSFGFYNNNYGEWATIYSIEPRFEAVKNDSIGKNF